MKRAVVCVAGFAASAALAAGEASTIAPFSAMQAGAAIGAGWKPLFLSDKVKPTRYSLVEDEGKVVLKGESDAAASALAFATHADPKTFGTLQWRWKIDHAIEKGDVRTKAGDDYAARVYVMFDYPVDKVPFGDRIKMRLAKSFYGADVPTATICYVWDNATPAGTSVWSAYTQRVRMIVLRSGNADAGKWLAESRDVRKDFIAAFGEEPPALKAIAVAVDTDNTGEKAVAYFGDFSFGAGR